jgi:hypothetical protein
MGLCGSYSARFDKPINKDNLPDADPLGSFTPESEQALKEADEARSRSALLRRELNEAIMKTDHLQRAAHGSVNDGLLQKLSETVTLRVSLPVEPSNVIRVNDHRCLKERERREYFSSKISEIGCSFILPSLTLKYICCSPLPSMMTCCGHF